MCVQVRDLQVKMHLYGNVLRSNDNANSSRPQRHRINDLNVSCVNDYKLLPKLNNSGNTRQSTTISTTSNSANFEIYTCTNAYVQVCAAASEFVVAFVKYCQRK